VTRHRDAGFTLAETLVATVLTMLVTGAVFTMINPRTAIAHAQPEASDMQQRARVGADAVVRDLLAAGAGVDTGPDAGSLASFLPPIIPRRMGLSGADADTVARADAVTLVWALAGFAQTTSSAILSTAAPTLALVGGPPCPGGSSLCGMNEGSDVLAFDDLGHFDLFRIAGIAGGVADLRRHAATGGYTYPAGARIVSAIARTYYLDAVNRQLRVSDGYLSDAPVIDNVVGLTLTYFGDPAPPVHPRPESGANCLYDAAGNPVVLARLASAGSLAPLPLTMLNDGPWCGEAGNRFDADVLRIRQVRVSLRVQSGDAMFRGSGAFFAVPGTATRADQLLPDVVITVDAAPRNLSPRSAPWSL